MPEHRESVSEPMDGDILRLTLYKFFEATETKIVRKRPHLSLWTRKRINSIFSWRQVYADHFL